ncbi:putative cytosolic oligopeptidase A [Vitis vinifera]|uniref:oligopeptidase A n=1 Tax=Vitis vinifera TaxID=29760 RepID=A0A438KFS5_VITVI|nr:putative cytosolic oligopeptidase A [Vitis vinifera]
MAAERNPLLEDFVFPPFDVIEPKHIRPAFRSLLAKLESDLVELETTVEPTWPKLVEPLEKIIDRLSVVWGIVNHLNSVKDSPELRSAIEEVQPAKVEFQLRLGQSKPIYNAFRAIRESSDWEALNDARKRIVEAQIKEAVLNGVSLEDNKREYFNEIQQELEKLSQKFEENILDSTKQFEKLITDKKDIEGLPATALAMAAEMALSKGHKDATAENGPWVLTLDAPSYRSVMQHARNRSLREEVYRSYVARASSGDHNNTPIIARILKLKLEKAKLLGYNNYAEVSMEMKMATINKAEELIEDLRSASWNAAIQDMEDLENLAKAQDAIEANDLKQWDINFWGERLRELKYDINEIPYLWSSSAQKTDFILILHDLDGGNHFLIFATKKSPFGQANYGYWYLLLAEEDALTAARKTSSFQIEELRPFFSLPKVINGLFNLAKMLFEIDVEPADGLAPVWNNDVKFYCVKDSLGIPIAYFYFDPYARPSEKRGGAWMDVVFGRGSTFSCDGASPRLPIAHIVCNQTPPMGDKPSLMTFREVETVFHEFGHALQHMLTKQDESLVSGSRGIEWDAVELASQFMENWCYQR